MHSEKVARETRIPHDIHIEPGDTRAWDQFYGQIRELYWEQDLPLDTVIQIFKSDYGFHATSVLMTYYFVLCCVAHSKQKETMEKCPGTLGYVQERQDR